MKIYLAARYSRRVELCQYRSELEAMGHEVTSRWLNGDHQISDTGTPIGESGAALVEGDDGGMNPRAQQLREDFAKEDIADIRAADALIAFTEPPRSTASRGGRHVAFGYALGLKMPIIIVGHMENVFCWLPEVRFCPDWKATKRVIDENQRLTQEEGRIGAAAANGGSR